MPRIIFAIFIVMLAQGDEPSNLSATKTEQRLLDIHQGLEKVRADAYGNCFLQGSESETKDNATTVKYFRFWSRGNQFFRCDLFEDETFGEPIDRIIVRPEASVRLVRTDSGLAIKDLTEQSKGIGALYQRQFFQGSTRGFLRIPAENAFSNVVDMEGIQPKQSVSETTFNGAETADGSFRLMLSDTSGPSKNSHVLEFAVSPPVLKHFEWSVARDGVPFRNTKCDFVYGLQSKAIPIASTETTSIDGRDSELRTVITKMDMTPQAMDLFSIEESLGNASTPGWQIGIPGLLLIGGAALLLISVLYFLRRTAAR